MFRIMNPQGVPFNVEYEDRSVTLYDARYSEHASDKGLLVTCFLASTLRERVRNGGDIRFSKWMPNALPEWWLSEENARDVWEWVESVRDPNEISPGMFMSDGTKAQVGQVVEFKWSGRYLKGSIVEILHPGDVGTKPSYVPKSRWKVSTEYYVLWERALVEVIHPKSGLPTYYAVAIMRHSRSCLRVLEAVTA